MKATQSPKQNSMATAQPETVVSLLAVRCSGRIACVIAAFILAMLPRLSVAQSAVGVPAAGVLPPGGPPPTLFTEKRADLEVKVLGGRIVIMRTFAEGKWHPNYNWAPLKLTFDSIDGSVKSIVRGKAEYTKSAPGVFVAGKIHTIRQTTGGFRWSDRAGNKIDFDAGGHIVAYSDRNNINVTFQYEGSGTTRRISGVFDHLGRQTLWYEYNADGQLAAIRDYTDRRVSYQYNGNLLTTVIDVHGNSWTYGYTGGLPTTFTDPENRVTTRTWSSNGELASIRFADGSGVDYRYEFDSSKDIFYTQERLLSGRVTETWTSSDGDVIRRDLNGNTIQTLAVDTAARTRTETDYRGLKTVRQYDQWDNITRITYPDGATVSFVYDPVYSRVTQQIDERGVVTRHEYDERGNLQKTIEAAGTSEQEIIEYVVDQYGRHTSATRKSSTAKNGVVTPDAVSTYEYDDFGNQTSVTNAESHTTRYEYHVTGVVAKIISPVGGTWTRILDATGRPTSITDSNNSTANYVYDKVGNLISAKDARNYERRFEYDRLNRVTKDVDAYGAVFGTEYNSTGLATKEVDEDGIALSMSYDADGRATRRVDARNNSIAFAYVDEAGQLSSSPLPAEVTYPTFKKLYKYDFRDRLIRHTNLLGSEGLVTSYKYDSAGNVSEITDANGRTRFFTYDLFGRPVRFTNSLNQSIDLTYDNRGNLIEVKDSRGGLMKFEYDRISRLTKQIRQLGQVTSYKYDANDNVSEVTHPNGTRLIYTYDLANQLIRAEVMEAGSSASTLVYDYSYDASGNLIAWSDGTVSGSFTYDNTDNQLSETVNYGAGVTLSYGYAYFPSGRKRSLVYPDGTTVNYSYSEHGELARIDIPGEGSIAVNEWNWLLPKKVTYPGGTTQETVHDGLLNLVSLDVKGPTQVTLAKLGFKHGKVEEILERSIGNVTKAYQYDSEQRLTSTAVAGGGVAAYELDATGNRVSHSATSGEWVYDANNRLIQRGSVTYEYDSNGDLIERVDGSVVTRFRYDAFGRLIQISDGSGNVIARYGYDPFDNRIWKEIDGQRTHYLYSDEGLIAEANNSGAVTTLYGWKPDEQWGADPVYARVASGETSKYIYFHNDNLGTPVGATDRSGAVVWKADYSDFGRATIDAGSTVTINLRFPGQYHDQESGLHYNTRRYYDPDIGRYISEDPVGYTGGWNLYAYAGHDPINAADPTGEWIWVVVRVAITAYDIYTTYKEVKKGGCVPWTDLIPIPVKIPRIKWFNKVQRICDNPCGCGVPGTNSFTADTLVHIRPIGASDADALSAKSNLKRIDQIAVGDEVLAFAEWKERAPAGQESDGRLSYQKVTEVFASNRQQSLVHITLSTGQTITATEGHPFNTADGWRDAILLKRGTQLLLRGKDGEQFEKIAVVEDVRYEHGTLPVFNLEVANAHTYFVGEDGALVHNGRRSTKSLRKEWEEIHECPWPRLPCGSNYHANHIVPLADGGVDHGCNIEPLTPEDHRRHHMENGDFKRWGARRKRK